MQSNVQILLDFIDSWFDEPVSLTSVDRIRSWPKKHVFRMMESWPQELPYLEADIPRLGPGEFRPAFASAPFDLSVLLYSPSIAIPSSDFYPRFDAVGIFEEKRFELMGTILTLAWMRPFLQDGSIVLYGRAEIMEAFGENWNSRVHLENMFMLDSLTEHDFAECSEPFTTAGGDSGARMLAFALAAPLQLARSGMAQPLAASAIESRAYDLILGRRLIDGRMTSIRKLIDIQVPSFGLDTREIEDLRSSDLFGRWRIALELGLSGIYDLPDNPESHAEARAMLSDSLALSFEDIQREVSRSVALHAVKTGAKGFSLASLGAAVTGFTTGDINNALIAGAVSGGANIGWEYLSGLHASRRSKAVWDVLARFQ